MRYPLNLNLQGLTPYGELLDILKLAKPPLQSKHLQPVNFSFQPSRIQVLQAIRSNFIYRIYISNMSEASPSSIARVFLHTILKRRLTAWTLLAGLSTFCFSVVLRALLLGFFYRRIIRSGTSTWFMGSTMILGLIGSFLAYTAIFYYDIDLFVTCTRFARRVRLANLWLFSIFVAGPLIGYSIHYSFLSCLSGVANHLGKFSSLSISILSSCFALARHLDSYSRKKLNRVVVPEKSQLDFKILMKKYLLAYAKALLPSLLVALLVVVIQILFYYLAGCVGEGISRDKYCFDCRLSMDLLCYIERSWYCKIYSMCTPLTLSGLLTTYVQSSFVFVFVLGTAQTLRHLMMTILFTPLDFAKHGKGYIKSSILESKKKTTITSADQLLSEVLMLGGVLGTPAMKPFSWQVPHSVQGKATSTASSSSSSLSSLGGGGVGGGASNVEILRKLRSHYWEEVLLAQHDIAEKLLCVTDSSPLGPPVLPFLAGVNDSGYNRQRIITWGQCLAMQDLAQLAKHNKERRKEIFNAEKNGKFVEIVVASCAMIDATTMQLQLVVAHAVEDVLRLTTEKTADQHKLVGNDERRAALSQRNKGPIAHRWGGSVPFTSIDIVKDGRDKLEKQWWWNSKLIRYGILPLLGKDVFCIRRICTQPLPIAVTQMTINAVDGVSTLLIKGTSEDVTSLQTHHVLAAVICSLLGLIFILQEFGDAIRRSRVGPMMVNGLGPGIQAIRRGVYLTPDLRDLLLKTDDCLTNLLVVYRDVVKSFTFPSAYVAELDARLAAL